jgi:hypothetical protein
MPAWMEHRLPAILARYGLPLEPPSRDELAAGLVLVTLVPALVLALAAWRPTDRVWAQVSLFVAAVFSWNALVPHLAATLLLREYTPGVATAVFVNLPWGATTFRRAVSEGVITRTRAAAVAALAAVLYPLGMALLWNAGARP